MKKTLLFFSLLFFSYQAQSQILISLLFGDKLNSPDLEFGLEGGLSLAEINSLDANKTYAGFNLGLYFDIRVKENLWVYTGLLLKSNTGVNGLSEKDLQTIDAAIYAESGDYSQDLNYFIAPAFAKYKFDNHMYLTLGPQFGLLRKGMVKFENDQDDIATFREQTNTDRLNRFDMGFTAGAGYTLLKGKGMSIGARYYYGLLDVYKDASGSNNSNLYVLVNIKIGAGKKDQAPK